MKRIALTGATGTLGRDVLAELVKDHLEAPDDIELFVLGRDSPRHRLRERIRGLVDDCAAYCGVPGGRWCRPRAPCTMSRSRSTCGSSCTGSPD